MHRFPASLAQNARPSTSSSGVRPTTSAGQSVEDIQFGYGTGYGYGAPAHAHGHRVDLAEMYEEEEEDEEEEESEDEDVFAFLPPTTADAEAYAIAQARSMQPPLVSSPNHPTYPSPTFDPYARYPADAPRAPAAAAPPATPTRGFPFSFAPQPQTPPSSTSTGGGNQAGDPYRMRRLSRPTTSASSQAVHVSLPSTAERERERDYVVPHLDSGPRHRKRKHSKRSARTAQTDYTRSSVSMGSDADGTSINTGTSGTGMFDFDDDISREGSIKMEFDFDAIEDEDSPFPEVRASVSNIDDPDMPALTARMWFVGLVLCMISSAMNVFFNFRQPAPAVVPLALLLVSYPCGKFMAFTLPITIWRIPLPSLPKALIPDLPALRPLPAHNAGFLKRAWWSLCGIPLVIRFFLHTILRPLAAPSPIEFSLNPGPWNIKEHVLVYIMANVAVGYPYAINAIVVSEVFYNLKSDYWFSLVLVLATQLTGFGLAGLCRRFLVWPASMVWPQNLVACTLLNTLHAEEDGEEFAPASPEDGNSINKGIGGAGPSSAIATSRKSPKPMRGITRYRFFVYLTTSAFFYFFLPGFLFQALSYFSFMCWIFPTNVPVNQIFGVYGGLGGSILTFDWTQISWIGSPLMYPWWAEVHIFGGFVLFYWILTPALYYSNSWNLAYFPISANQPFDKYGKEYNITRVLLSDDTFNLPAYEEYSPLYLPATYAVCYLVAFTLSTCVITHTLLYHGRSLLNGIKKMKVETDDIHAKLMRNYPEVPDWWYLLSFGWFFGMAVIAVEVWDTEVPVWALLLSVLLPMIYILPSGFIFAMTGQGITLNILAQIIPGTLLPGKPFANMVFKSYSVQTLTEATSFVQDLKLGHYIKVPPRATFLVQLVSTVLAAFVQVGVKTWIFENIPDMCDPHQKSQLTCPHNQVFYTASAVWGLIGPSRQFSRSSVYHPHLYAMIVGIFLPIPFWFYARRRPNSWVKYVSTPVILNGVSAIPPATGINYSSWFVVGFVFQYLIRRRNFAWWSKFNYVTSAALDSGTVLSLIFIFFTLQFPKNGTITVDWWGNNVYKKTADFKGMALLKVPDGGIPG